MIVAISRAGDGVSLYQAWEWARDTLFYRFDGKGYTRQVDGGYQVWLGEIPTKF